MKRTSGFTLIELLIVMAVLAVLLSIALLPNFKGLQNEAKSTRVAGDLRTIRTALEAYNKNHNSQYPAETDYQATLIAAVPQIIPTPLYDPFAATSNTPYVYSLSTHDPATSWYYIVYSVGMQGAGNASINSNGNISSSGDAIWTSNSQ
jgi:prepilin-type N-terminal cleavage/methylation domain-containing protein